MQQVQRHLMQLGIRVTCRVQTLGCYGRFPFLHLLLEQSLTLCLRHDDSNLYAAMSQAHSDDSQPGSLVKSFSWELEVRQRTESDTAQYDQLRSDVLAERDRRERQTDGDIERLTEMFEATR